MLLTIPTGSSTVTEKLGKVDAKVTHLQLASTTGPHAPANEKSQCIR